MYQGLGYLDPLAHALGVRADRPGVIRLEIDGLKRCSSSLLRVGDAAQDASERDKLDRPLFCEEILLLRNKTYPTADAHTGSRVASEHLDGAS